jgi:hypothetical protein
LVVDVSGLWPAAAAVEADGAPASPSASREHACSIRDAKLDSHRPHHEILDLIGRDRIVVLYLSILAAVHLTSALKEITVYTL